jgi:hypothetical protein
MVHNAKNETSDHLIPLIPHELSVHQLSSTSICKMRANKLHVRLRSISHTRFIIPPFQPEWEKEWLEFNSNDSFDVDCHLSLEFDGSPATEKPFCFHFCVKSFKHEIWCLGLLDPPKWGLTRRDNLESRPKWVENKKVMQWMRWSEGTDQDISGPFCGKGIQRSRLKFGRFCLTTPGSVWQAIFWW